MTSTLSVTWSEDTMSWSVTEKEETLCSLQLDTNRQIQRRRQHGQKKNKQFRMSFIVIIVPELKPLFIQFWSHIHGFFTLEFYSVFMNG